MKTGWSAFLKSFLISFVIIFSLGAILFSYLMNDQYKALESSSAPHVTENYSIQEDEEMNILIAMSETREAVADRFLLLNIDPIDRMVIVTGIPNNAQATVNIKTGTISELYDYGGAPMAVRAVQNLFFITIDRYIRVDNESLAQIVDMFGGVEYEVEQPAVYQSPTGSTVEVETGRQLLDGRRFAAMLRNRELDTLEQVNTAARLSSALFEQRMGGLSKKLDSFYREMVNLTDTNLSSFDYEYRKHGLTALMESGGTIYQPVVLDGKEEGEVFTISDISKKEVKELYRLPTDEEEAE